MIGRKKVGLALGSGGLRGLAHIGVLKVLVAERIPIDFLAGSSAGAIAAAYFAVHGEIESLEELVLGMRRIDLIRLIDLTSPRRALIWGKKIQEFLDKLFLGKSFLELRTPLTVVAADLRRGKEVCLTKGRVSDAVLASMTLPGALPPVRWGKSLLIDGGVLDPTPTSVVKKMGAKVVIGVDLTMVGRVPLYEPTILETLMRSFEILRTQMAKLSTVKAGENLVIIKPKTNGSPNLLAQFNQRAEIVRTGERAAGKALAKIEKLLYGEKKGSLGV